MTVHVGLWESNGCVSIDYWYYFVFSSYSPSAVALFLLEPQTCEYILGIETPIVCSLLSHADDLGLFTRSQAATELEVMSTRYSVMLGYEYYGI